MDLMKIPLSSELLNENNNVRWPVFLLANKVMIECETRTPFLICVDHKFKKAVFVFSSQQLLALLEILLEHTTVS